jgi:hypothetical protein
MDLYHKKQVENNKTRSSEETGFFSQSQRALDYIYVVNCVIVIDDMKNN